MACRDFEQQCRLSWLSLKGSAYVYALTGFKRHNQNHKQRLCLRVRNTAKREDFHARRNDVTFVMCFASMKYCLAQVGGVLDGGGRGGLLENQLVERFPEEIDLVCNIS